jgi:hypothetical protein
MTPTATPGILYFAITSRIAVATALSILTCGSFADRATAIVTARARQVAATLTIFESIDRFPSVAKKSLDIDRLCAGLFDSLG